MEPQITKYKHTSTIVMGNGNFEYSHNVIAPKNKWGCYMDITRIFMIAWVILATINSSKIKV